MSANEFIFSTKSHHRVVRHLTFWIIYCTFFWLQSFAPRNYSELFKNDTYYFAFLNMCAFGPVFVLLVYIFIYVLLPILRQQRYLHFFFYFILSYAVGTAINYYTAGIFLNSVNYSIPVEPNFQRRMEFGNYNTRWGMIIAVIALGIKLSKDWYLQQQENLNILTRKTRAEMQLQKARLHPELLFRSLDKIYFSIQTNSKSSQTLILNLSDLLSYSLYESERDYVSVDKELSELRHLISLENLNNEFSINLKLESEGVLNDCYIVPMTLIKVLEECIDLCQEPEPFCSNMSVYLKVKESLQLRLYFTKAKGKLSIDKQHHLVASLQKMLNEHYHVQEFKVCFENDASYQKLSVNLMLKSLESSGSTDLLNLKTNSHEPA